MNIVLMFSSYGLDGYVCGIHMPLILDLELTLFPRFYLLKMGECVKKYKPEHIIATPAFYDILIDSEEMKGFDVSFMLTMGSGGDLMNTGLKPRCRRLWTVGVSAVLWHKAMV